MLWKMMTSMWNSKTMMFWKTTMMITSRLTISLTSPATTTINFCMWGGITLDPAPGIA